ncbi:MAG: Cthe_2314 family HEPN domain-containing protein [Chitinophagaceae bacterium]
MAIEAFREFDTQFRKTYDSLGIQHLGEWEFQGENSGQYICRIETKTNIHPYPYSIFKIHDEFDFITKDIKYITGLLYLLRPHINNTYEDRGYYHQTNEDHRYLMFANFGLQSIYNFWDRLGDLLFLFFETGLSQDQVYFGRVINNMASQWKQTKPYIALKQLYDQEVKSFLDSRHEAVHHFQLECKFYWGNVEFLNDMNKLKELNEEKVSYPEKMSASLSNCLKAFKLTVDLICELPDK